MGVTAKAIKVVIAEEDPGVREDLVRILAARPDIALKGQTASGREARGVVERVRPHVLLLSITLPELGGIEFIPTIRKESPNTKVIVMLPFSSSESAAATIRVGARGYILKGAPLSTIVKAITAVHEGGVWAERHIVSGLLDELSSQFESQHASAITLRRTLTERELWIARLVASGLRNNDIAKMLSIDEKTVKAHLTKIFRKLGLNNRVQLVLFCWRANVGEEMSPARDALASKGT